MDLTGLVIIAITVLGFLFPSALLSAMRAENDEDFQKYKARACFCFAGILFLASALINS